MATLKERPDTWKARGLRHRDFRHTHDGPEEMPHKKEGAGKKKPFYRSDHKHIYETNGWQKSYLSKYSAGRGYVTDYDRWYWIRKYECLECGKRGDYHYNWNDKKPDW